MYKYVAAALLAGTAFAATPALAQDTNSPFTGFRIEGLAGYDVLKSGEAGDDGVDTGDNNGDESIEGLGYGVGVGFDFDLGGVVVGAEAELSESSGERESDETVDGVEFFSRLDTGRDIYVGGRIGAAVTPSTLLYAKAGYTNLAVDAGFETDGDVFEADTTLDGYRLGAGVEQLLGPNAYAKLEYRYSNYDSITFDADVTGTVDTEREIDIDRHQVMAGVGFRF